MTLEVELLRDVADPRARRPPNRSDDGIAPMSARNRTVFPAR